MRINKYFLSIIDVIIINLSLALSCILHTGTMLAVQGGFFRESLYLIIANTIIKVICLYFFGLYSSIGCCRSVDELTAVLGACFVSNASIAVSSLLLYLPTSATVFLIAFFIDVFLLRETRFALGKIGCAFCFTHRGPEKTKGSFSFLPQLANKTVSINDNIRGVNFGNLLERRPVWLDIDKTSPCLKNRIVLVTGGGGWIGSELCRQVAAYNPRMLIILDNYENNTFYTQNELAFKYPSLDIRVVIANIRERDRLVDVFSKLKPEVVFHTAAHKHVPLMENNPGEAIKNNVFGTLNLVECSIKYGVEKFVLISSDKAVNPTSIMGATKRIAEMIIQAYRKHCKTVFTAVRFGNVLGSSGSVVPLFKWQIEQGGPVTITHPDVTRYFMTVTEAVQLVIQSGIMATGGEIFVLDMGEPVKICDLAKNLIKLSGLEPDKDIKIQFTGLRPGEKLFEEILLAEGGLKTTHNHKIFIEKPVSINKKALKSKIDGFYHIDINNLEEVKRYMKTIVPHYNG